MLESVREWYTNNRTYREPFTSDERRGREFGGKPGGPPFPSQKIEFGIGRDAISPLS